MRVLRLVAQDGLAVAAAKTKSHKIPFKSLFEETAFSSLGAMPVEAIFATLKYCEDSDDMPDEQTALSVFKDVPAKWIEIPVEAIKAEAMATVEIGERFKSFDEYHAWYVGHGDTPLYGASNRWPCIASLMVGEVVQDGSHRLHAYIRAGHLTIPVLQYNYKAWWRAHSVWKKSFCAAKAVAMYSGKEA